MPETSKPASQAATATAGLVLEDLRIFHLGAGHLTLAAGECASLSGPSGSGKSLFLRAIADLLPHEGRVSLDGRPRSGQPAPAWRRQVMLMPPEPAWWMPRVGDHFPDGRLPETAARLNLPAGMADRDPAGLSSGEGQRLAFLRALARQPRVLLLDEPSANLDADNARCLEALLRDWLEQGGMAVLVSHDADQCRRLCRKHWRIRDNQVVPS